MKSKHSRLRSFGFLPVAAAVATMGATALSGSTAEAGHYAPSHHDAGYYDDGDFCRRSVHPFRAQYRAALERLSREAEGPSRHSYAASRYLHELADQARSRANERLDSRDPWNYRGDKGDCRSLAARYRAATRELHRGLAQIRSARVRGPRSRYAPVAFPPPPPTEVYVPVNPSIQVGHPHPHAPSAPCGQVY
jgi:hypothetical protein